MYCVCKCVPIGVLWLCDNGGVPTKERFTIKKLKYNIDYLSYTHIYLSTSIS